MLVLGACALAWGRVVLIVVVVGTPGSARLLGAGLTGLHRSYRVAWTLVSLDPSAVGEAALLTDPLLAAPLVVEAALPLPPLDGLSSPVPLDTDSLALALDCGAC